MSRQSSQYGLVRTVLGDIEPAELGVCYAHEHVVIDSCHATRQYPAYLLNDLERIVAELKQFRAAGGQAMVDSMPGGCGRNAAKMAQVSRQSQVHLLVPTGIHLEKYYPPEQWPGRMSEDDLVELFISEIRQGMDGTPRRAGLIKVAGAKDQLSHDQRKIFRAAAQTQRRTGAPILTHTEQGTAALEQIDVLTGAGADLAHVVLSHLDRNPDPVYHRQVLKTGVRIEYDSAFRWKQGNPTLDLLAALLPEFPAQIMLGMDAARWEYWESFGGSPGLTFLLRDFVPVMMNAGIDPAIIRQVLLTNPAQTYQFCQH